jgi:hypothetical protein
MKKMNLPINNIITNYVILMGLFVFNCENTITKSSNSSYGVVINEINYKSSDDFNPEDWVELHNPTNKTIAIGLWTLKDDNDGHEFTIPENIILSANDFIVICNTADAFETLFPEVNNFIGDLGFGLGGGDQVRLFDSSGLLVDKVDYDEEDPWPVEPDGTGPTLELINPSLENDMAANWAASNGNGTPGAENSVYDD